MPFREPNCRKIGVSVLSFSERAENIVLCVVMMWMRKTNSLSGGIWHVMLLVIADIQKDDADSY